MIELSIKVRHVGNVTQDIVGTLRGRSSCPFCDDAWEVTLIVTWPHPERYAVAPGVLQTQVWAPGAGSGALQTQVQAPRAGSGALQRQVQALEGNFWSAAEAGSGAPPPKQRSANKLRGQVLERSRGRSRPQSRFWGAPEAGSVFGNRFWTVAGARNAAGAGSGARQEP